MSRIYAEYLSDICGALEKCLQFTADMDFAGFAGDEKTMYAVVRALEVGNEHKKICLIPICFFSREEVKEVHSGEFYT